MLSLSLDFLCFIFCDVSYTPARRSQAPGLVAVGVWLSLNVITIAGHRPEDSEELMNLFFIFVILHLSLFYLLFVFLLFILFLFLYGFLIFYFFVFEVCVLIINLLFIDYVYGKKGRKPLHPFAARDIIVIAIIN